MAQQSTSSKSVTLFLVFAVPLFGGLVATPFYLGHVQTVDRQLDAAIVDDTETIRRAVLNLDVHLAALRDSRNAGEKPEDKPDDELLNRSNLLGKEAMTTLSATSNMLRGTADNDVKQRGLKCPAVTKIAQGGVNLKTAYSELQSKYFTGHDKMLKDAETAVNRLRTVSKGGRSGSNHLWTNRIQSILGLAKGRIQRNRADFEDWYAAELRDAAEGLIAPLSGMKLAAAAIEAEKPTTALAAVEKQLEENAAEVARLNGESKKLSGEINSAKARAAQLDNTAAQMRARMNELAVSSRSDAESSQQFAQLSGEARKAEAESTAILNGTLEGAHAAQDLEPGAMPTYEGGKAVLGVRDLEMQLEGMKVAQELRGKTHADLARQQESLKDAIAKLDAQKADVAKQVETLSSKVGEILAAADAHTQVARKASDEAVKTFSAASKLAKSAVSDAKKRTSDAKAEMSVRPPGQDDRLQRVSSDIDTEASMQCLSAEIALETAQVTAGRMEAMRSEAVSIARIASVTGGEKPVVATEELDKLRTEAANQVAEALKAYEQAANLIGKGSAKFSDGSVTGKNYLWQVQVAQAAAHLLNAALNSDKPDDSAAAKAKAYALLTEAAKGKEQSPLLAPAVETLVYLQQTAR